jgi:hypothetical protein
MWLVRETKLILVLVLITSAPLCFAANNIYESEPNGCITLAGGNDSYQSLQMEDVVYGSVSTADTETCLFIPYSFGNEYIEDLYVLNVDQTGDYTLMLNYSGMADLDLFIFDLDLNILNGGDCGQYICGFTCGNPEIVNINLNPGTYIIGVSLATLFPCNAYFFPANYILSILPFSGGEKPVVSSLSKAGEPFRVLIFGHKFLSGVKIYIDGTDWQNFALDGSDMIKLKKGSSLKAMFPKDGSWVPITIVNPGNVSTTIEYNRTHHKWRQAGR